MGKMITGLNLLINNPKKIFYVLANKGMFKYLSDETYLKLYYESVTGKKLDLNNPKTYNEKLQWLKINDRKKEYNKLVDKFEVRDFIKKEIGEQYLIPLIGIYESVDEICWDDLPNKFAIKCTHSSATNIVCTNKSKLDIEETEKKFKKWLKDNLFWYGREWPYKDLQPRIICEQLLETSKNELPEDYKIFCFNGEAKAISIHSGRFTGEYTHDIYDTSWNKIDVKRGYPNSKDVLKKPDNLEEMLVIARKLSKGLKHVRVDLYNVDGRIYFGEITFFTGSGFRGFEPEEYDEVWGEWINLN